MKTSVLIALLISYLLFGIFSFVFEKYKWKTDEDYYFEWIAVLRVALPFVIMLFASIGAFALSALLIACFSWFQTREARRWIAFENLQAFEPEKNHHVYLWGTTATLSGFCATGWSLTMFSNEAFNLLGVWILILTFAAGVVAYIRFIDAHPN